MNNFYFLKGIIDKQIAGVKLYYYNSEGFKSLDWVKVFFTDGENILLTTGAQAEKHCCLAGCFY